jgi:hypothetical protein
VVQCCAGKGLHRRRDSAPQTLCGVQVCEQTFNWLSRFKHSAMYMGHVRFNWYVLRMCDLHNQKTITDLEAAGMKPRVATVADRGGADFVYTM